MNSKEDLAARSFFNKKIENFYTVIAFEMESLVDELGKAGRIDEADAVEKLYIDFVMTDEARKGSYI